MAEDKNPEKINKNTSKPVNESSLKQTINSVSLDGIDSLIPETETTNTKQTKDQTTSSLSGIDDITSYIQKQKEKTERISPDLLTARDGTDLRSQEGVYAIVPHKKNDHKIVYTRENAPKDLIPDPKKRKKGSEYKKNGMKIYDVHVDYAEHPTLMSADGKPLDVWIIDDPKDLDDQLQAIRNGKGGGTNFMSPVINKEALSTKKQTKQVSKKDVLEDNQSKENTTKEKKKRKPRTKKTETKDKETNTKSEEDEQSKQKKDLSLDDILPSQPVEKIKNSEQEDKKESTKEDTPNKDKSLSDILPVQTEDKQDISKVNDISNNENEDKDPKELKTLDDILPTTKNTGDQSQKEKKKEQETNESPKKDLSLNDILPSKKQLQKDVVTEENVVEEDTSKKKDLSLDDILPSQTLKENTDKKEIATKEPVSKTTVPQFSLDDILPSKQEDEELTAENNVQEDKVPQKEAMKQETSSSQEESNKSSNKDPERIDADKSTEQKTDTINENKKDSEVSLEVDKKKTKENEEKVENTTQEKLSTSKDIETPLPDFDLSEILPQSNDKPGKKHEAPKDTKKTDALEEVDEEMPLSQISNKKEEIVLPEVKITEEPTPELELPEIELPDLESFMPKNPVNLPDPVIPTPPVVKTTHRGGSKDNTTPSKADIITKSVTVTPDWSADFSATDIIEIEKKEDKPLPTVKKAKVQPTEDPLPSETFSSPESLEPMGPQAPQEAEPVQDTDLKESDDLIDLDDMTFEPIVQDESRESQRTVYNDGIIGNEDQEVKTVNNKGKLILLIIKSFFALVLVGLVVWIGMIMLGGSKKTVDTDTPNVPAVEDIIPDEDNSEDVPTVKDPIPTPEPQDPVEPEPTPEPTQPVEDPEPVAPEPTIQQFTIPELIAKIQAQQIEARKLLNKAKLLNDREGIKFSTAALLKSSKLLDQAKDDPTTTADQLQRDAQTIDLYLGQAQSIVEG